VAHRRKCWHVFSFKSAAGNPNPESWRVLVNTLLKSLPPLLTAMVIVGAGYVAYSTKDHWVGYVFPDRTSAEEKKAEDAGGAPDRVKLTPQAIASLKLRIEPIALEPYWRKLTMPGTVIERLNDSDREVATKMAGIVTEIKVHQGETVREGDHLFTIQLNSEFLQSLQTDLAKSLGEMTIAEAQYQRVANMVRLGTKSPNDLAIEDKQVKRLQTQIDSIRRQLGVLGLSPAQIASAEKGQLATEATIIVPKVAKILPHQGKNIVLTTLDGHNHPPTKSGPPDERPMFEVQELKVHLGSHVQAGQTLCILSNHQFLFIEGQAFKSEDQSIAQAARANWPVEAEFYEETKGDWDTMEPLTIRNLSNVVSQESKTFAFYLPLRNQFNSYTKEGKTFFVWRFRPGQRVRLKIPVEKLGEGVIVLPESAVVREGAEAFVFRQNGDLFQRTPVQVLYQDRNEVVLAYDGSIGVGQYIVRNHAAVLNRAMKANEGGGGHHHHEH
jgi:multidrug efflux pump subunit AcrA (membrane-fusion protein)